MSEQGALFTEHRSRTTGLTTTRVNDRPVLAATGDAETSHLAAQALITSGKHAARMQAALAILAAHRGEATAMELAKNDGVLRYEIAKRLPECRTRGWCENPGTRIDPTTGKAQQTWRITEAGRAALAGGAA